MVTAMQNKYSQSAAVTGEIFVPIRMPVSCISAQKLLLVIFLVAPIATNI